MGEEVEARSFTREDRRAYREKLHRCLDALERMLAESAFDFERPTTGLEVELYLVDDDYDPAMRNAEALERIADPTFQTELGRFNVEINVKPRSLAGDGANVLETELREALNNANERAGDVGAHMVMVGVLPTLRAEHLSRSAMSSNPRYALLNDQIFAARGEDLAVDIRGPESLQLDVDTILPEAACTSVQFHLQVPPERFADYWNAAQCIAAVQVAMGANSPYLLGKRLWDETRIPLFEQTTDTRSAELAAQGVRPRVWFGERYITSVFDLFTENFTYFPALLPITDDEDPIAILEAGGTPRLPELRLHNGTVWRWNRPVYDVVEGRPHLRVENRVLPAGPTVVDILANGALYYGLLRSLVDADRPIWTRLPFSVARDNFETAARDGIEARIRWPGAGQVAVRDLVRQRLLPLARAGLADWGVDAQAFERLLGVVEGRCRTGVNGAVWQTRRVAVLEQSGLDRDDALRRMLVEYCEYMHTNEPVHLWPLESARD